MSQARARTAREWPQAKRPLHESEYPAEVRALQGTLASVAGAYDRDRPEDGSPVATNTHLAERARTIVEQAASVGLAEHLNPRTPRDAWRAVFEDVTKKAADELAKTAAGSLDKLGAQIDGARNALLPKREVLDLATSAAIVQQLPADPLAAERLYRSTTDPRWRTALENHPGVLIKGKGIVPLVSPEVILETAKAEGDPEKVQRYEGLQRLDRQLRMIVNTYLRALGSGTSF
jgi:hypothetical protein